MVRTRITALVALLTLFSANFALAFGLGEITLKSYLNQPFVAEIELLEVGDLTQDEIIPKLASAKDFANVGLQRDFFLTSLKFEVVLEEKSGRNFILITSSEPVTEPFLDFLVEFLWPEGRLLRGYTVLLDPPTYATQAPQDQSVPVVEVAAVDNSPTSGIESAEPVVVENTEAVEEVPVEEVAVEESNQAAPAPEEAAPVSAEEVAVNNAPADDLSRRTITTAPKDTLWSIAAQERPVTSVSVQQTMVAIQSLNPDAFLHNNINYLKKNQVLRIPTEDEIRSLAAREALGIVADQNREWAGRTVASGGSLPTDTAKLVGSRQVTPMDDEGDVGEQMKLVAEAGEDGEAIGTSSGKGSGSNADENAKSSREAAQLLSQTKALKSQVETSERLISLKDQQIAELQARLAEKNADTSTSADEEVNNVIERVAVAEPKNEIDSSKEVSEEKEIAEALAQAQSDAGSDAENKDTESTAEGENATKAVGAEEEISFETKNEKPAKSKSAIKDIETPAPVVEEESSNTLLFVVIGLVALLVLAGLGFFIYKKRVTKVASSPASATSSVEDDDDGFGGIDGFGDSDDISDNAFGGNSDSAGKNVLTEADTYISFNRYTQAIELLKKAIQSGNDDIAVKIKLLEAYVGVSDQGAFDDLSEDVLSQDRSKKSVIEKLASQMKGGTKQSFDMEATTRMNASDFDLDANSNEEEFDISLDDLANDLDSNFSSDEDDSGSLDLSEEFAESSDDSFGHDTKSADTKKGGLDLDDTLVIHSQTVKISPKDDDLELDLDDLSFDEDSSAETESGGLDLSEDDGLDLDFDMDDEIDSDSSTQVKTAVGRNDDLELDLGDDFSFDEPKKSAKNDELDLSSGFDSDLDLDGELNLEEDLMVESDDSSSEEESLFGDSDGEDFELPDDGDEAATKLDLARAYIDMGDEDGAKDILQEVMAEGDASQKAEAKQLLAKL